MTNEHDSIAKLYHQLPLKLYAYGYTHLETSLYMLMLAIIASVKKH